MTTEVHAGSHFSSFFFTLTLFPVNDTLEFDEVDFDEPMEVEHEEEKPAVKEEPMPKAVAPEISVKAELKAEPQDPVLM